MVLLILLCAFAYSAAPTAVGATPKLGLVPIVGLLLSSSLLFVVVAVFTAFAADAAYYKVEGTVLDADDQPLACIQVRLEDDTDTEVGTSMTDQRGRFQFLDDESIYDHFVEAGTGEGPYDREAARASEDASIKLNPEKPESSELCTHFQFFWHRFS